MKTLIETNPHLQDKKSREFLSVRSARNSCEVEGIEDHSAVSIPIQLSCVKIKAAFNKIKARVSSINR
jgi:hypothetical protein